MPVTALPTAADMRCLADWQAIAPGFGRDSNVFERHIQPILQQLEKLDTTRDIWVIENGGNSAHVCAFVRSKNNDNPANNGMYVYMSLLAPIAAVARGHALVDKKIQSFKPPEPSEVLTLATAENDWERAVITAIEHGGFELLTPQQAMTPLPAEVTPYEYCLTAEPWDRLFHVLFSLSD